MTGADRRADAVEASSARAGSDATRARAHLLWLLAPFCFSLLVFLRPWLPEPLRLGLGFVLLLFLPGWILDRLLTQGASVPLLARLARAFALSIAIGSFLGMAGWFLGGDVLLGPVGPGAGRPALPGRLSGVVWGVGAWTFIGSVILAVRARRGSRSPGGTVRPREGREGSSEGGDTRRRKVVLAGLTGLALAAGVLGFYAGGGYGYVSDSPDHISHIREMVERDRILPRSAFYIDGDGAAVDSRKGFFHVLMAAWSLLSGIDPVRLWDFMPGLLMPVALIAFFLFARRLLRGEAAAFSATVLALICFGTPLRGAFFQLGYGYHMATILSWMALALSLEYLLCAEPLPSQRLPLLVALSAFAAGATHIFAMIQVLFSLGVFGLALLIMRGPRHPVLLRLARLLPVAIAGCLLPFGWRMLFAYAPLNPIHTHPQGLLFVGRKLYTILPGQWGRFLSGMGFGGVFISLFFWKRARRDDASLYLASLSLAPVLIVANPLVVPSLQPFLGYLVGRLALTIPFLVVIAEAGALMGRRLLDRDGLRRVLPAVAFYALLASLLVPRVVGFVRAYMPAGLASARARSVQDWNDLLAATEESVPEPSVILSDPVTGYSIPALTSHYTVSVLHQHGSPCDSLALQRLAACRDVLSPFVGVAEKGRLCRRFRVDYVLVNETFDETEDLFYAFIGPARSRRSRESLEAESELFQRIWSRDSRGALFRVRKENIDAFAGMGGAPARATRDAAASSYAGGAPPAGTTCADQDDVASRASRTPDGGHLAPVLPAGVMRVATDSAAGITLAAVGLDTTSVGRGTDLPLTLYWRRAGAAPRFPVEAHLRMETQAPHGPLWSQASSKLDRYLEQRRTGLTYRHRLVHIPLEGQLGIEDWPEGEFIVDRVVMPVPSRAAAGHYELKIKWMEQTFLPNLSIRDFTSDRDLYDGEAVAGIEVR